MAKAGAKKQLQENQARLNLLKKLLLASNAWFAIGRLLVFRSSTTWNTYLAAAAMTGIQAFCFTAVTRMAEPLLGASGEILDGGADLLRASIASYYQDLIYLCAFVQFTSVFTDKAFWAFWLIPLVGGWILYTSIVRPILAQRSAMQKEAPETEAEKKRREKAERKASRPKFRSVR